MKLVSLSGVFENSLEYVDQRISDMEPSVEDPSSFLPQATSRAHIRDWKHGPAPVRGPGRHSGLGCPGSVPIAQLLSVMYYLWYRH